MARTYIISEICGDWALQIREPGHPHQFLYFNSENNADLVKSILEWEDEHPNEAVPYKPTLTPPNEWASVEERMPEEEHLVLAYSKMFGMAVAMLYSGSWYGYNGEEGDYCSPYFYVTHWMHLPEPPCRRPPEGEEDT